MIFHYNKITVIFLVFVLFIDVNPVKSQFMNGFAGKYVNLKTDVLRSRGIGFRNIEAEFLLFPKLTANVGYNFYKSSNVYETIVFISPQTSNFEERIYYRKHKDLKASVKFTTINLGLRYYFSSEISPAPRGVYLFYDFISGNGEADINYLNMPSYIFTSPGIMFPNNPFKVKDIKLSTHQMGFGRQSVLNHFITLDFGFSILYNTLNHKNAEQRKMVERIGPYFGQGALGRMRSSMSFNNWESGVTEAQEPRLNRLSLDLYIKIGIMLF